MSSKGTIKSAVNESSSIKPLRRNATLYPGWKKIIDKVTKSLGGYSFIDEKGDQIGGFLHEVYECSNILFMTVKFVDRKYKTISHKSDDGTEWKEKRLVTSGTSLSAKRRAWRLTIAAMDKSRTVCSQCGGKRIKNTKCCSPQRIDNFNLTTSKSMIL